MLLKGPPALRREPIYYYNLGCYEALLGHPQDARRHLETSFQMDANFREIAKNDPDLKNDAAVVVAGPVGRGSVLLSHPSTIAPIWVLAVNMLLLAGVTGPGYNSLVERDVELVIEDIAFGGKGVGRAEGKAVFVPFTIEGERVTARVVREKKSFAEADLVTVLEASPQRTAPQCPYFGRCGGCSYQHMSYEHQLHWKSRQVRAGPAAHRKIP